MSHSTVSMVRTILLLLLLLKNCKATQDSGGVKQAVSSSILPPSTLHQPYRAWLFQALHDTRPITPSITTPTKAIKVDPPLRIETETNELLMGKRGKAKHGSYQSQEGLTPTGWLLILQPLAMGKPLMFDLPAGPRCHESVRAGSFPGWRLGLCAQPTSRRGLTVWGGG